MNSSSAGKGQDDHGGLVEWGLKATVKEFPLVSAVVPNYLFSFREHNFDLKIR